MSETTTNKNVAIATPSHRRALRTKLLCFYAKHEPDKSIKDVNDLVDWALANGVDVFNKKLKAKYNEDLSSIKATSLAQLELLNQLKLFYGEFDPQRTMEEIKKVISWVEVHGLEALNIRMIERYNENLNSLAFGGCVHLKDLLQAFYKKHDESRLDPHQIDVLCEWTILHGAQRLNDKLFDKYGDELHLSVDDIENSMAVATNKPRPARDRSNSELPTPQTWAQVQDHRAKAKPNFGRLSIRSVTSNMSTHVGSGTASDPTVDPDHLHLLIELFYARHAPQKLLEGGVDKIISWAKVHGLQEINQRMRASYGQDLTDLETEYEKLYIALEKFYTKHDPNKNEVGGGIEDVAAWGVVHSADELNERLKKKYGVGLDLDTSTTTNLKSGTNSAESSRGPTPEPLGVQVKAAATPSNTVAATTGATAASTSSTSSAKQTTTQSSGIPPKSPSRAAATTDTNTKKVATESVPMHERPKKDPSFVKETEKEVDMEEEMEQMRKVVSGNYTSNLSLKLNAFYSKHDPAKLKDTEAIENIIKWALKNGVDKLNEKLTAKWGENLDDMKVVEPKAAAADAEPNW